MAANDSNGFDYYRSGEVMPGGTGTSASTGFDYFRSGEPFRFMTEQAAAPGGTILPQMMQYGLYAASLS